MISSINPLLIKVSIVFSILYLMYVLFFKNKTFYGLNRAILLAIIFFSLCIPLLEFNSITYLTDNTKQVFELGNFDNVVENIGNGTKEKSAKISIFFDNIKIIYTIGVLVFLIRFMLYLGRILYVRLNNDIKKLENITIIYTKNNLPPFSFFYWVFLPEDEFKKLTNHPIIEHERLHAKHWHSFDLVITELFSIFLWFVPFVYSFKNSIKSVHEYQADNFVINNSTNITDYLRLLASNTEKYTLIGLSNNFYCKTLKNRITMITKKRSSKISKLQYLVLLPAIGVLGLACSESNYSSQEIQEAYSNKSIEIKNVVKPTFIQPIDASQCEISSGFGMRVHPTKKTNMMHHAIDFKAKIGTPVMASAEGTIIKMEFVTGYGNVIAIQHSHEFITLYAQLSEFKTEIGNTVKQGDLIGLVGSSGISTGPHLHFELRKNEEFLNPADFIKP